MSKDYDVDTCQAKYDSLIDAQEFTTLAEEQYKKQCAKDCSDAIYDLDDDRLQTTMISIGNLARLTKMYGDLDDKIDAIDKIADLIDAIIAIYANSRAEKDLEDARRRGEI
jgi:hypothetical protein